MSVCGEPSAVPAMSRCAHGVLSTKRCSNCAAVIEPPQRPPVFFMSANLESIILSYSGPSGMRQTRSPVASPALVRRSHSLSSLENMPAYSWPSATMMAPVSVARSIMNFGLKPGVDVMQHVGEHEPAFGVGVDDLDGLARHGGDDVARPLRIAVRHVLDAGRWRRRR